MVSIEDSRMNLWSSCRLQMKFLISYRENVKVARQAAFLCAILVPTTCLLAMEVLCDLFKSVLTGGRYEIYLLPTYICSTIMTQLPFAFRPCV